MGVVGGIPLSSTFFSKGSVEPSNITEVVPAARAALTISGDPPWSRCTTIGWLHLCAIRNSAPAKSEPFSVRNSLWNIWIIAGSFSPSAARITPIAASTFATLNAPTARFWRRASGSISLSVTRGILYSSLQALCGDFRKSRNLQLRVFRELGFRVRGRNSQ